MANLYILSHLICRWYIKDENSVPTEYVLQPISTLYPNFLSSNIDTYKEAKNDWWATFDRLQKSIHKGVDANLTDPARIHDFYMGGKTASLVHDYESE